MSKILNLLIVLLFAQSLLAQGFDRLWFTGYNEFPGVAGYGQAQIRFENDTVLVEPASFAFNFESTVAVMSDSTGQLLFYSNGCSVANRNHEIMANGSDLNPGEISDLVCPWKGYIVPQGAMVLPSPANDKRYFLIHTGARLDPVRKLRLGPLYYTEIDMEKQSGLGAVISKNNILIDGDLGAFSAIRHGNGRDWWVILPAYGNHTWYTFLLSPSGFEPQPQQAVALTVRDCEKYMCTAVSRKGNILANWGDCKVTILDFDRCSGAISRRLELEAPTHWIPGGGLAFSNTDQYLYATSQNVLFRADLEASKPKFDTMRFSYDPFLQSPYDVPGNTFHYLSTGPNGFIYGNIPSRASHLHVLKKPDAATISGLDFKPRGLGLPIKGVRTLPHLPNYRLYDWEGSLCDTLGISANGNAPERKHCSVNLAPNPSTANSGIGISACPNMVGIIIDATGKRIDAFYTDNTGKSNLNLKNYSPGIYFLKMQDRGGMIISKRFIVSP